MISTRNITKPFDNKKVHENISIAFDQGKVYGIFGENGAGKTTLFRCIANLENYKEEIDADFLPLKNQLGPLLTEPFFFTKDYQYGIHSSVVLSTKNSY
jgi:ABC-2 type transport system ATP-binding protein